METYIYILILLGIFSFFRKNKVVICLSFLLLLIVGGLRDFSVGTDTLNYLNLYEYGDNTSFMKGFEWGYTLIQQFVYFYVGDYTFLVFTQMLLILLFFYIFILRESDNPLFSVFCFVGLYYWLYSLNTTRQYLAIPLVLIGFSHLNRDKVKPFIGFVLMAMLFHTSAFFALIVLVFRKDIFSFLLGKGVLVLSFVIGLTPLIPVLLSVFVSVFDMLGLTGFSMYLSDTSDYRIEGFSVSRFLLTIYGCLILLLLDNKLLYVRIFIFGIILLNLFAFQPDVARLAQYFVCIQIVLIPNIPIYIRNEKNIFPLQLVSLVYMVITFLYLLNANVGEVVPYKFNQNIQIW